jgi:hypothetical protein
MKMIAVVAIYLAGGVALFPFLELLRPVGMALDSFYSWLSIGSGVETAQRLSLSFIYASLFHLVCAACSSTSARSWVSAIRIKDLCARALWCLGSFSISLVTLGLVGLTTYKVPKTDFHQYFTYLVICMLLGAWAWSLTSFLLSAIRYTARKPYEL